MHRVPIIALLLIVEDCRAYDLTKDGECRYVESFELREIYRGTGIEAESRARDLIDDRSASVARMKNLTDSEVSWQWLPPSDTSDLRSTTAATCDQDQLEPILRAQAERQGDARVQASRERL